MIFFWFEIDTPLPWFVYALLEWDTLFDTGENTIRNHEEMKATYFD